MKYLSKLDKALWIWAAMNSQLCEMMRHSRESKTKSCLHRIKRNSDDLSNEMGQRGTEAQHVAAFKLAAYALKSIEHIYKDEIKHYDFLLMIHLLGLSLESRISASNARSKKLKQRVSRWLGSLCTLHDHIENKAEFDESFKYEQAAEKMLEAIQ